MSWEGSRPPAPGWTAAPQGEADGRALMLYVDVDAQSVDRASEQLRNAYRLLPASHDREACALLQEHSRDLVAVCLDIDLPGSVLDGILLTRILRNAVPTAALPPFARDLPQLDVPIVLVTADPDSYSEAEVRRYGGDCLLAKPVDIGRVTLAITEWHLRRTT